VKAFFALYINAAICQANGGANSGNLQGLLTNRVSGRKPSAIEKLSRADWRSEEKSELRRGLWPARVGPGAGIAAGMTRRILRLPGACPHSHDPQDGALNAAGNAAIARGDSPRAPFFVFKTKTPTAGFSPSTAGGSAKFYRPLSAESIGGLCAHY
jgi:hypothetical protein